MHANDAIYSVLQNVQTTQLSSNRIN